MTDANLGLFVSMMANQTANQERIIQNVSKHELFNQTEELINFDDCLRSVAKTDFVSSMDTKTELSDDTRIESNVSKDNEQTKAVNSDENGKEVSNEAESVNSNKVEESEKTEETVPVSEEEPSNDLEGIEEAIVAFAASLVEIVSENFDIEVPEIMDNLEAMDMEVSDLMETSSLASFVAEFSEDTSPIDLLKSPEFTDALVAINDLTNETLEELGITYDELVKAVSLVDNKANVDEVILEETEDQLMIKDALKSEIPLSEERDSNVVSIIDNNDVKMSALETIANSVNIKTDSIVKEEVLVNVDEEEDPGVAEITNRPLVSDEETKNVNDDNEEKDNSLNFSDRNQKEVASEKTEKNFHHENVTVEHANLQNGEALNVETQTIKIVDLENLVKEITEYIELSAKDNVVQNVTMQLNPEHLGKLLVSVSTVAGEVTTKIVTETEAAKEALMSNLNAMRESLEEQGIKVADVEVTVESHAFEQNLQEDGSREQEQLAEELKQHNQRRNLNLNELTLDDLSGLMSEEDMIVARMMKDSGNVLDVTA